MKLKRGCIQHQWMLRRQWKGVYGGISVLFTPIFNLDADQPEEGVKINSDVPFFVCICRKKRHFSSQP